MSSARRPLPLNPLHRSRPSTLILSGADRSFAQCDDPRWQRPLSCQHTQTSFSTGRTLLFPSRFTSFPSTPFYLSFCLKPASLASARFSNPIASLYCISFLKRLISSRCSVTALYHLNRRATTSPNDRDEPNKNESTFGKYACCAQKISKSIAIHLARI